MLMLPILVSAAGLIPANCTAIGASNCGLLDFLQLGNNIYEWLFGILGSVTLVIFMYGGLVWLTSAGNAQRVEQGKKIFEGALIGLALIFSSWLIVNFVVTALTGGDLEKPATIFNRPALEAPATLPTQ